MFLFSLWRRILPCPSRLKWEERVWGQKLVAGTEGWSVSVACYYLACRWM